MSSIYGGEQVHATITTDGTKAYFTPDAPKFFSNTDQLLDYIRERCGNDVVSCIDVDNDVQVSLRELTDRTDYCNALEILHTFDFNKSVFTETEMEKLRELALTFEMICSFLDDIINL